MKMLRVKSVYDVNSIDDLNDMPRIFSTDSPKAIKSKKYGWINAIHYAAPHTQAAVGNLCPSASVSCIALCLGLWSGQAAMRKEGELNNVVRSRIVKSRLIMKDRKRYLRAIAVDIAKQIANARKHGMQLAVRLNGATDIGFHRMRVSIDAKTSARIARFRVNVPAGEYASLMHVFSSTQFVDYTKVKKRMFEKLPANYDLTYSVTESNHADAIDVLRAGKNVAAVFDALPDTWQGFRVIDGDKHDLRHLDDKGGFVVGLLPKGNKAKRDTSGFVIRDHIN